MTLPSGIVVLQRMASFMYALVKFAPVKSAPPRFAPVMFASRRIAFLRSALARIASTRIAPRSFAPSRFALDNSHPLHSLVSISLFKCAGSKADALVATRVTATVIVANNRITRTPFFAL